MRTFILNKLIAFGLLVTCSAGAQNFAVRFLSMEPRHEFHLVTGCPTNWPVIVDNIGTNASSPHYTNSVILTLDQLTQHYAAVRPAFTNWFRGPWSDRNAVLIANTTATNQLLTKFSATNAVDSFEVDGRLLRALAELLMDEINIVRTNPAAILPPRTLSQLKTTIKNKVLAQPDSSP